VAVTCRVQDMPKHRPDRPAAVLLTRGRALAARIALAAAFTATAAATAAGQGVVYTASQHGKSVSAIDLATGRTTTVEVGIAPHNVQTLADGRLLLASAASAAAGHGHGSGHEHGRLLAFKTGRLAAGPIAEVEVGRHPAHVVVDPAGRLAFLTNAEDATIAVVDLGRAEVVKTIATGAYPHGLRISLHGRELYIANVDDGSVSVIDTAALAEVARIPVGKAPVQVGFTPDGQRAFVTLRDENSVAAIDTRTRRVLGKIGVGRGPIQIYATPDGHEVYVANEGTREHPDNRVR
jgi:YVTN family beta-propeller protein